MGLHLCITVHERLGRPRQGFALLDRVIRLNREEGNLQTLAHALVPHAMMSCDMGKLRQATEEVEQAVAIMDQMADPNWQAICHRQYGWVLMLCGHLRAAAREFNFAASIYGDGPRYTQGRALLESFKAELYLHSNQATLAVAAAAEARRLALADGLRNELALAVCMEGAASRACGDRANAERCLSDALSQGGRLGMASIESACLVEISALYAADGAWETAQQLAEKARAVARSCEHALREADANLLLATLALRAGNVSVANEHARLALEASSCDGPEYTYRRAYERAITLLAQLREVP